MSTPFVAFNKDATLIVTKALPAAASTSVSTDAIDLGENGRSVGVTVDIPALSTTIVPNASTVTTTVQASNDATFATYDAVLVSVATGAGGAGVGAAALYGAVPPVYRYVRANVAFGASTTTGAAISATLAVVV